MWSSFQSEHFWLVYPLFRTLGGRNCTNRRKLPQPVRIDPAASSREPWHALDIFLDIILKYDSLQQLRNRWFANDCFTSMCRFAKGFVPFLQCPFKNSLEKGLRRPKMFLLWPLRDLRTCMTSIVTCWQRSTCIAKAIMWRCECRHWGQPLLCWGCSRLVSR